MLLRHAEITHSCLAEYQPFESLDRLESDLRIGDSDHAVHHYFYCEYFLATNLPENNEKTEGASRIIGIAQDFIFLPNGSWVLLGLYSSIGIKVKIMSRSIMGQECQRNEESISPTSSYLMRLT